MRKKADVIIVGSGIVGLATGLQLKLKYPSKRLLIIEKESDISKHQTGHNSGVIHSGVYYKPGSLKARNCIDGYSELIRFAKTYDIPFDICGKLIVATCKEELPLLKKLFERGNENGLKDLTYIDKSSHIRSYEPYCNGVAAVHVPQTGIIDYKVVAKKIYEILLNEYETEFIFNQEVRDIKQLKSEIVISTMSEEFYSNNVISCAGLHSDKIAKLTTINRDLRIIPFRGEYYKLNAESEGMVKNLIYPVPNPNFPFLGVHFTRMIGGGVEAGPNAVFAFKREGYKFSDINLRELFDSLTWPGLWKVIGKYGKIGIGEMHRSLSKKAFTEALQKLLPELKEEQLIKGGAGVRAQACNRDGQLIDDFDIIKNGNIIHVRNAPSPAATSCFAIGRSICELIN